MDKGAVHKEGDRLLVYNLNQLPAGHLQRSSIGFLAGPQTVTRSLLRIPPWVVTGCPAPGPACVAPFAPPPATALFQPPVTAWTNHLWKPPSALCSLKRNPPPPSTLPVRPATPRHVLERRGRSGGGGGLTLLPANRTKHIWRQRRGKFLLHNTSPHLVDPPPCQQRSQCKGRLKAINLWQHPCPQKDSINS